MDLAPANGQFRGLRVSREKHQDAGHDDGRGRDFARGEGFPEEEPGEKGNEEVSKRFQRGNLVDENAAGEAKYVR